MARRAFIVRPFGIKEEIDFEKVDRELIQPALQQAGITGSTTAAIVEQGNIREDMFAQLLLADIVIADLSIHNANVFYELGIRHALRDKRTFLIRCSKDEVPFDLKTDRYLIYNVEKPGETVPALVAGLTDTFLADKADSPVFYMLPKLEPQDPEKFLVLPPDFGEEVKLAAASGQNGKLALMAFEAEGFPWEIAALRGIAEALFKVKDFETSGILWEKVRDKYNDDKDANDRLATIYQRLAEVEMKIDPDNARELLEKSDQAVERLTQNKDKLDNYKLAEIRSLKARNAKARWVETWRNAPESEKQLKALQSTYLFDAYEAYSSAFTEDLNHTYSGINSLGLLTVIIHLAETLPEYWSVEYDTDEEAKEKLEDYKRFHQRLSVVVHAAIEARKKKNELNDVHDDWLSMTEADYACLTATKPLRVTNLYLKVLQESDNINFDAAERQLKIYDELGLKPDNVKAALTEFDKAKTVHDQKNRYTILFTGHMIDKPDRAEPRFPADKENDVRAMIKQKVSEIKDEILKDQNKVELRGLAGGACGGDIIFHEVCAELGIETELYLALPRDQFLTKSVEFAGSDWVDRFDALFSKLPRKFLSQTQELPKWLQKKRDYTIWERNNLWMLNSALACGGINMTLIAFWNGKGGDNIGGTEHMVKAAKQRGSKTEIINAEKILNQEQKH